QLRKQSATPKSPRGGPGPGQHESALWVRFEERETVPKRIRLHRYRTVCRARPWPIFPIIQYRGPIGNRAFGLTVVRSAALLDRARAGNKKEAQRLIDRAIPVMADRNVASDFPRKRWRVLLRWLRNQLHALTRQPAALSVQRRVRPNLFPRSLHSRDPADWYRIYSSLFPSAVFTMLWSGWFNLTRPRGHTQLPPNGRRLRKSEKHASQAVRRPNRL